MQISGYVGRIDNQVDSEGRSRSWISVEGISCVVDTSLLNGHRSGHFISVVGSLAYGKAGKQYVRVVAVVDSQSPFSPGSNGSHN